MSDTPGVDVGAIRQRHAVGADICNDAMAAFEYAHADRGALLDLVDRLERERDDARRVAREWVARVERAAAAVERELPTAPFPWTAPNNEVSGGRPEGTG